MGKSLRDKEEKTRTAKSFQLWHHSGSGGPDRLIHWRVLNGVIWFLLSTEADATLLVLPFSCCLLHRLIKTPKCTSWEHSLSNSPSKEQRITDRTPRTVIRTVSETGFPEKLEGLVVGLSLRTVGVGGSGQGGRRPGMAGCPGKGTRPRADGLHVVCPLIRTLPGSHCPGTYRVLSSFSCPLYDKSKNEKINTRWGTRSSWSQSCLDNFQRLERGPERAWGQSRV